MSPHFDRALLPPAREFYEKELGKLSRPSRGWAKGNCPFHESKSRMSFTVNLANGGFHCFGCDAKGGDVVAFLMRRDNVPFKQAAQMLGAWHDQSPEQQQKAQRRKSDRENQQAKLIAEKEYERQKRIKARDWLHSVEALYESAAAKFSGSEIDWELMPLLLSAVREAETDYWQAAGLEVRHER